MSHSTYKNLYEGYVDNTKQLTLSEAAAKALSKITSAKVTPSAAKVTPSAAKVTPSAAKVTPSAAAKKADAKKNAIRIATEALKNAKVNAEKTNTEVKKAEVSLAAANAM